MVKKIPYTLKSYTSTGILLEYYTTQTSLLIGKEDFFLTYIY